jgi:hypothetical protein
MPIGRSSSSSSDLGWRSRAGRIPLAVLRQPLPADLAFQIGPPAPELAVYHSRKKPTPKTAPTAVWVELIGRPSQEAMMTVIAAASATQKARIGFSRVICWPTMRISLGPNRTRPTEMPTAPIAMTQSGMADAPVTSSAWTVATMAASGPTALATSLAPCAKDSSAAEQISGTLNSARSD